MFRFLWAAMEKTISGQCTKTPSTFDEHGDLNVSTLKQLCIIVLQKEEVIMHVTQKSSQLAHSGFDYLSESFETMSDNVTSFDNDNPDIAIEYVDQKQWFQSLYKLLLHVLDVVLVLSDTAEKLITELNGRNLDQAVLWPEMSDFQIESSEDIGLEVDKETAITSSCVATVPEKSHYSHSTGFHVSIAGGIKVKFTVDMIALKKHPTELTNALCHIVCTTCEEMTLITVSKLMANEGHSQVSDKQK